MGVAVDWQKLAAFVAVVGAIGGLLLRMMLARARGLFTPRASHDALSDRVAKVEQTQRGAPTQTEMAALTGRVASVETGVAVAQATLRGVSEGVGRVEHLLDLLVQHQLRKETP